MSTNNHVTFAAARRRFELAQPHRRGSKLSQAERQGMGSPSPWAKATPSWTRAKSMQLSVGTATLAY
ncbi:hypothetical protein [Bradyrhizobium diazoefficiens]